MESDAKKSELAALIKSRGYVKGTITKAKNFMTEQLASSCDINVSVISLRRERLTSAFEEYNRLCLQIHMLNKNDTEDSGNIETVYFEVAAQMDDLVNKSSPIE